jgi:hypothetical protein
LRAAAVYGHGQAVDWTPSTVKGVSGDFDIGKEDKAPLKLL